MTRFTSIFSRLLLAVPFVVAAPFDKGEMHTEVIPRFDHLPISNPNAANIIPNRYIVVYNNTFDDDAISAKEESFISSMKKRNLGKRGLGGDWLPTDFDSFKINKWRATSLAADDDMINEIFNNDEVAYVEADTTISIHATSRQADAPAGLARISHAQAGASEYVFDDSAGKGITVYVIDTGIKITHSEFDGRATWGANFVDQVNDDQNGHGSHVAGTIGGSTFGVAKKVDLVAVKVLNAGGKGPNSGILKGLQFAIDDAQQKGKKGRAVVNMSVGGEYSEAVNRAIEALRNANIVPVVAAGNDAQDAANVSPASAPNAITVGAIDATNDSRAYFSNYGQSVDIYAPGVDVLSCGIQSESDTAYMSGTSMASPHVAGLAAYLMALRNVTQADQVVEIMKNLASKTGAAVNDNAQGTTSLIANNGNL
ncbi:alkaline protease (oryzin) [Fusarium albosuccineum]|uniref:Alkaline protease (Oryzin) n=1 Tax=Fusarium albosuccineum TaxID=1237068 RepID=A0A8H4KZR0_9HYPO|nr:alkaline protease (oryzin) [Fusarium albosuccineum]